MTIQINSIYDFEKANLSERSDYFLKKELHELSVEELAYIHLDTLHFCTPIKGCIVSTSLRDLERNASSSFSNIATKRYTPVFICFAMLDQLGSIYKTKNKKKYKNKLY